MATRLKSRTSSTRVGSTSTVTEGTGSSSSGSSTSSSASLGFGLAWAAAGAFAAFALGTVVFGSANLDVSTSSAYDRALDAAYDQGRRARCTVTWREPPQAEWSAADGLLSALQEAAAPYRPSVEDAGVEQDARRLLAAAAAARQHAALLSSSAVASGSDTAAELLLRLADAAETDAGALLEPAAAHGALQLAHNRWGQLASTASADPRWSAPLGRVAASAVRLAVARCSMLAASPSARLRALLNWVDVDAAEVDPSDSAGIPGLLEHRGFCGAGTDPELVSHDLRLKPGAADGRLICCSLASWRDRPWSLGCSPTRWPRATRMPSRAARTPA